MSVASSDFKKVTTNSVQEMKRRGEKISMLTAYDFTLAGIVDKAGVDVILVGDSASNVMAGHEMITVPATLSYHLIHLPFCLRCHAPMPMCLTQRI